MTEILDRITALRANRTPFVLATVVASYPPQSVRAGAKAVILGDGTIDGWIGGGCIRPVVLDEAREVLKAGLPRLVRMNAGGGNPETSRGVHYYPMTCQGEGGVEIYLEPMLPSSRLCVLGETPVAESLRTLAGAIGQSVTDAPEGADAVVVATMGVGDEEALAAAATSGASYVGLVASRKKAQFLLDYARASGVPDEQLARVKFPAGLDLGGMSPGEIALSILAEIVQRRCHLDREERERARAARATPDENDDAAIDPICGMTVQKAAAKHVLDVSGETYYFCCPHCKASFAKAHA